MTYAFQTSEKLCFILDLMNGGDLHYHLSQSGLFTETQVKFYASEIILGLEHMHSRNIVYRDLKVSWEHFVVYDWYINSPLRPNTCVRVVLRLWCTLARPSWLLIAAIFSTCSSHTFETLTIIPQAYVLTGQENLWPWLNHCPIWPSW